MNASLKTRDALYAQGLSPPDKLNLDEMMDIYGVEYGVNIFDLDELKYQLAPDVALIRIMPETEAKEFLGKVYDGIVEANLSGSSALNAGKYYTLLNKAHEDSMKELHADPIKWGIKHHQIEPLRFDTPETFGFSLAQKAALFTRKGF